MLKNLNLPVLAVLVLFGAFSASAQADRQLVRDKSNAVTNTEKRVALVIGNGAYRKAGKLSNPVNDATDMKTALAGLGFEVIYGANQTKTQMQNLIRQFGVRLAETKGVGLFYYAGHGVSYGGFNYLVPVEADIQGEDEIEEASVSVNFLLGKLETAKNGFNMVILDACRDNPFAKNWSSSRNLGEKGGLARMDAPTGTLITYATKPGDVAADGAGRNGLYTGALLKQIRVKNLEVAKMLQNVRADVIRQSNGKQVPFEESSLVGDFYFAGLDPTDSRATTPVNQRAAEDAFWRTIENSADARDFENYIARSERGEFAGTYKATAELKLSRLKNLNSAESNSAATTPSTETIISSFAEKEREIRTLIRNFSFTRSVKVSTINAGKVTGQYSQTSDFAPEVNGGFKETVTAPPVSTLTEITVTAGDLATFDILSFTLDNTRNYNFTYLGKEKLDELNLYVFDIAPKEMPDPKTSKATFLQGKIWVDDKGFEIVKMLVKRVPEPANEKNPTYEVFRAHQGGSKWFPSYAKSREKLTFASGATVEVMVRIEFSNFKSVIDR